MSEIVLLLVDLQNDYFPGGAYQLADSEAGVNKAALVLAACRAKGFPVIHVRHEKLDKQDFFLPGTKGAEIHPMVAPREGDTVVLKHRVSSFEGTDLDKILEGFGAGTAIVCGMQTNFCVKAAVRDLKKRGFRVILVSDALAAVDTATHEKTLAELSMVADSCQKAEELLGLDWFSEWNPDAP